MNFGFKSVSARTRTQSEAKMAARNRRTKLHSKATRIRNNDEISPRSCWDNRGMLYKVFVLLVVFVLCVAYVSRQSQSGLTLASNNDETTTSAQSSADETKKRPVKSANKSKKVKKGSLHSSIRMKNLTIDGRTVFVKELKHNNKQQSSVRIYQVDNFLTKHECDALSAVHVKHVQQLNDIGPLFCFSEVGTFRKYLKEAGMSADVGENDFVPGTSCINETFSGKLRQKFKWSYSTAFYTGESKFSFIYEERLQNVAGLLKAHGGKFQVTSYPKSIGYKSHTDCTIGSSELRDRYATALVYLQNVRGGGETIFSKLGISVQPRQGRLIVWNNMDRDGKCDPSSVHEAASVVEGRKYILQRWYYFKNFPSLGRRPVEPDIPKRKPNQPKVSCDKFEEGSCRWYDEWGYDHLHSYKSVESSLV